MGKNRSALAIRTGSDTLTVAEGALSPLRKSIGCWEALYSTNLFVENELLVIFIGAIFRSFLFFFS
jgi:hypothetical protein